MTLRHEQEERANIFCNDCLAIDLRPPADRLRNRVRDDTFGAGDVFARDALQQLIVSVLEDAHAVSRHIPSPELFDRGFERAEEQRQQRVVGKPAEHMIEFIDQLGGFLRALCAGKRLALGGEFVNLLLRHPWYRALQRKRHHYTAYFKDTANLLPRELAAVVAHDRNQNIQRAVAVKIRNHRSLPRRNFEKASARHLR